MRQHRPSRFDLKAFEAAIQEASAGPKFTPEYLHQLELKRDQYLCKLAS